MFDCNHAQWKKVISLLGRILFTLRNQTFKKIPSLSIFHLLFSALLLTLKGSKCET